MSKSMFFKRLLLVLGLTVLLLATGTGGFLLLPGWNLAEAAIPEKTGLIVIALSHRETHEEGRLVYNPGPDERIDAGDVLIVLGHPEQVDDLRAILSP